jgi:hypothetical protein
MAVITEIIIQDNQFLGGGQTSTVRCALGNLAGSQYSTVFGGRLNTIVGPDSSTTKLDSCGSTIVGGSSNKIDNSCQSSIIGGYGNLIFTYNQSIKTNRSSIGGGFKNVIYKPCSSIIGGKENKVQGIFSSIGGGDLNTIGNINSTSDMSDGSTIAGGWGNKLIGNYSVVLGGTDNYINLIASKKVCDNSIGGGTGNIITDSVGSSILGGQTNLIENACSVILGGASNLTSLGTGMSSIGGGTENRSYFNRNTLLGGCQNVTKGSVNYIGGGSNNQIGGDSCGSVIFGGTNNSISQNGSTIFGGDKNFTDSAFTTILGGASNFAGSNLSSILGTTNQILSGNDGSSVISINAVIPNNSSQRSVIVGGDLINTQSLNGLTDLGQILSSSNINTDDSVFTPKLRITDIPNNQDVANLGLDSDNFVVTGNTNNIFLIAAMGEAVSIDTPAIIPSVPSGTIFDGTIQLPVITSQQYDDWETLFPANTYDPVTGIWTCPQSSLYNISFQVHATKIPTEGCDCPPGYQPLPNGLCYSGVTVPAGSGQTQNLELYSSLLCDNNLPFNPLLCKEGVAVFQPTFLLDGTGPSTMFNFGCTSTYSLLPQQCNQNYSDLEVCSSTGTQPMIQVSPLLRFWRRRAWDIGIWAENNLNYEGELCRCESLFVPETQTYFIGVCSDATKITLNGTLILDQTLNPSQPLNYTFWNVYPITLIGGQINTIKICGVNRSGEGVLAYEIYSNPNPVSNDPTYYFLNSNTNGLPIINDYVITSSANVVLDNGVKTTCGICPDGYELIDLAPKPAKTVIITPPLEPVVTPQCIRFFGECPLGGGVSVNYGSNFYLTNTPINGRPSYSGTTLAGGNCPSGCAGFDILIYWDPVLIRWVVEDVTNNTIYMELPFDLPVPLSQNVTINPNGQPSGIGDWVFIGPLDSCYTCFACGNQFSVPGNCQICLSGETIPCTPNSEIYNGMMSAGIVDPINDIIYAGEHRYISDDSQYFEINGSQVNVFIYQGQQLCLKLTNTTGSNYVYNSGDYCRMTIQKIKEVKLTPTPTQTPTMTPTPTITPTPSKTPVPVAIACGGELDGAIAQVPPPPTPSATPAPTPTPTPTCAKFTLFSRFESI